MAISLADLAVAAMDQEFGSLIAGNVATAVDRFGLGAMNRRSALAPGGLHSPTPWVRRDVLVRQRLPPCIDESDECVRYTERRLRSIRLTRSFD